ncbi:MAG: hypothetical protein IPQ07_43940 [Myxococcales bacterium]|nr:hypothetical protein [Myxococcales bacterium]
MLLAARAAAASPCEPSAALAGDPALVATVGDLLVQHGIGNVGEGCPRVRARLERRDRSIVVVRVGDPEEERVVTEPATAATIIESWSRSDFENPLLATHAATLTLVTPVTPAATSVTSLREALTPSAPPLPSMPARLQLFSAAETSFADDRTSWVGFMVGVCVQLGRACASARGRYAAVVDGPGMWSEAERHAADVLFGGDIPFRLGHTTLSTGFGAGMGSVHTGTRASGMPQGSETFGLRADAHMAWTIPLGLRIALEVSATLDVSQVTDVEGSVSAGVTNEPRIFGRLGAGLRFGGM